MRWLLPTTLAIVLAAGCALSDGPVAIWTKAKADGGCLEAIVGGVLVADPESGLAFKGAGGAPNRPVRWPFGWTARRESGVVLLLNAVGKVIAREGDRIVASGGNGSDLQGNHQSVSVDCGIQVNPSAEP